MNRIAPNHWLAVLLAVLCLPGCRAPDSAGTNAGPALTRHAASHDAVGTTFRVTVYAPDARTGSAALAAALGRLDEVDRALNPDRPDSDLSKLNAAADGADVKVGDDLFAVLQHAQRLAAATRGAFDVTTGAYADLWRRAAASGRAPLASELENTRLRVGWDKLRLNSIERSATLTVPGMRVDLNGIACGYAADEAFRQFRRHGCERARVDAGSVVVAGEAPPGRGGWPVELAGAGPRGSAKPVPLATTAIGFSPNTRPANNAGPSARAGVPRLVDPASGRDLGDRAPATVLARSGATAECVAFAAVVLGPGAADVLRAAEGSARIRFESSSPGAPAVRRRR